MYRTISISLDQRRQLLRHAADGMPYESCAILLGTSQNQDATVAEIHLTENADRSSTRFTVPSEDLMEIYATAERKGLEVVAIFHSHPLSEAYPSATDQKFMFNNPVVWVIAGLARTIRAFVLDPGVREIPIIQQS